MTSKTIYTLTIIFIICSCGPRTGTSDRQSDNTSITLTPDPKQVQYFKNTITIGKKVFLKSCANCHCGPGFRLENPESPCKLEYAFDRLPMDSLSHFIAFVKNSSRTKKGLRNNPFLIENSNKDNCIHEFEKTLSDSLIKTVVEYIWLGHKRAD
jgi:hypothetical protein